jgi:hypothetical protein
MQWDKPRKNIVSMEVGEIALYRLYQTEAVAANVKRDELPYTANFDRIVAGHNAATNTNSSHNEVWLMLLSVLKAGEKHIDRFLAK